MTTTTADRLEALLTKAERAKAQEREAQAELAQLRKQLTAAAASGLLSAEERRRVLTLARKPRRASSRAA